MLSRVGLELPECGCGAPRRVGPLLLALAVLVAGLPLAGWAWLPSTKAQAQEAPPATSATPAAPAAPAPDQAARPLPPAEQILDQVIEAIGGREALERIHSHVTMGTFEVPAAGITATMKVYAAAPCKIYTVAESDAIGKIESGTDGEVFWETTTMTGPRIKEGEEKAMAAREARFHSELEWRSLYKQVETVAITNVDGRDCYAILMTPPEGKPEHHFYDVDSHLLRKVETTIVSPMGEIRVETFTEDYRLQDGIQMPFRSRSVLMGIQELIFTADSIRSNVEIPDSVFAPPAEIKALLAKPEQENKSSE